MVFGEDDTEIIPLLNAEGYDVVIVNHPLYQRNINGVMTIIDGGADYIERNAMAHVKLYQTLNTILENNGSNEELVIIGPSMGGQISRYALAYMEKEYQDNPTEHQWNHNTRLWVSLDSPHQGANIPLGAQVNIFFFGYIHSNQVAKDNYDLKIKSVAARQQLILQYPFGATSLHTTYYNNLKNNGLPNSNGYPMNLRKIAMINGSLCNEQDSEPSQKVLDVRGYKDLPIGNHKAFQNQIWNIGNLNQSNKIYYGMVDKVFSGYSLSVTHNNNFHSSLDMVSGGIFDTFKILKEQIVTELEGNDDIDDINVGAFLPNHTFIPTHSALDTSDFSNWYQPISNNLVDTNQTPFDSYYGEMENTDHVSFTESSKNWLFEELAGNEMSPSFLGCCPAVSDVEIEGNYNTCEDDQAYFTSNYYGNTNWFVSDCFQIVSIDNAGVTIKIKPFSGCTNNPSGSVTAIVNCMTTTKFFSCTLPKFNIIYDENLDVKITITDKENELPIEEQGITDVQWELTSGNSYILNSTSKLAQFNNTSFTGKVTVTNNIGSTTKTFFWPDPNKCYSLVKVNQDKYQVIDRCNNNEIMNTMSIKEIYDIYGNKIGDIPLNFQDLDIINTGNSGDIRIIKVKVNNQDVIKTIIKD